MPNTAEGDRIFADERETERISKRYGVGLGWCSHPLRPDFFVGKKDFAENHVCVFCLDKGGNNFLLTELPVPETNAVLRPCGHIFHPACILRSFVSDLMTNGTGDSIQIEINNAKTCPLCRLLPRTRLESNRRIGEQEVRKLSEDKARADAEGRWSH